MSKYMKKNGEKQGYSSNLVDQALYLSQLGFSVIPVQESKQSTLKWKKYQNEIMDEDTIRTEFSKYNVGGLAIVCGGVSMNLEVIDVDVKHDDSGSLGDIILKRIKNDLPGIDFLITTTVNNGLHIYYSCQQVSGSKELARNKSKKVLVETRGEGAYAIAYPTKGYSILEGSYDQIPVIAKDQRNSLFKIGREFNQVKESDKILHAKKGAFSTEDRKVTEDYNRHGDIIEVLKITAGLYIHRRLIEFF